MKAFQRPLRRLFSSSWTRFPLPALLFLPGVLLLGFFLLSCAGGEEKNFEGGSFRLTSDNMQNFTVVRSDSASDLVVKESLRICQTISDATGRKVNLVTDWQRKNADGSGSESAQAGDNGGVEVLIGITSRAESQALLPELLEGDYYLLRTVGGKILIASTSESLLTDAVDCFLSEYVDVREGEVRIARKIDHRSEKYSFFSLVRGGESQCGFVLPKGAGEKLESALHDVIRQMEKDFGCSFQVYREGTLSSLQGMVVVGAHDSALCHELLSPLDDSEGLVKYAGEQLFIAGKTEESTVAALGEFYALLRATPDTDYAGRPYLRLEKDISLRCDWRHTGVPYLLGGRKEVENSISSLEEQVIFDGVNLTLLENYTNLLKRSGFSVTWNSVRDNRSFLAENSFFRLRVNHSETQSTASVYIFKKSAE